MKKNNTTTKGKNAKVKSQFDATTPPGQIQPPNTPAIETPVAVAPVVETPVAEMPKMETPETPKEPESVPLVNANKDTIPGLHTRHDFLCSVPGMTWNGSHGEQHEVITPGDVATDPFARFEYNAVRFPGSSWHILKCSDTGHEVGVPFQTDSYTVVNNSKMFAFLEKLQSGIEKQGLKLVIMSEGTLRNRFNQFWSFKIAGLDKLEVGGREIRSFLSLLKSLDKTVSFTFVNSTITVCCANTFKMVQDDTGAPLYGKVKLTKNADVKIAEIPLIVEAFVSGNNALLKRLNEWHSIEVTSTQAEQLFAAWLGDADKPLSTRMHNIILRLKELHGPKGKGNKGETALDAFN